MAPPFQGGRVTTAVALGPSGARALVALVLVAENAFVMHCFANIHLRAFSASALQEEERPSAAQNAAVKTTKRCCAIV